jgi:heat shock protein HslJ
VKLASIALAAAALIALGACGSDGEGDSTGGAAADPAALEGKAWILSEGIGVAGWEQAAPSVNFERGEVGGSSGCNGFGGTYEVSGSRLEVAEIISTLMACPPPAGEVEEEFMDALEKVSEWGLDGKELVLRSGGDELRFRVASPEG